MTLAGLLLVAVLLILPLVYSAASIHALSNQGRLAVYQAEHVAHGSKILLDQAAAMEHSVRLSAILNDAALLAGYYQSHDTFRAALRELATTRLAAEQAETMQAMDQAEADIFREIGQAAARRTHRKLRVNFAPLHASIQSFLSVSAAQSRKDADAMQEMADRAGRITAWLLIGLIPFAMLLALAFSALITRPIRQIDRAIRAMGSGELSKAVRIDGPQDLRQLGERLDWMRLSLLEIEKQKATFLQHISHELKTPLASIREGADLLSEGIAGTLTAKQAEIAQILHANSVQLQKHIEDLLNFNALQTGKAVLIRQPVALGKILDDVVRDHCLAMENKSLKVERVCPDLTVESDEQKLRIIVDNLLSNAIKYSSAGGLIRMHALRHGGRIRLDVTDFGAGVDPEDRERIFDPFYQGRRAPQGRTRGTGLGLSIARGYALAHGGTLALADDAEGTCFRLTLPAMPVGAPA